MALTPAHTHDLAEAAALINSAYRGDSARAGWTHEADYLTGTRIDEEDLIGDLARKPAARLLVWRDQPDGPILGCVWLEPEAKGLWYLGMLTVRPNLQDRKLGRTILEGAESYAKTRGARAVRMTVISIRDTLITWYARRGYRATGERQPFPYSKGFGNALRRDLEFVLLEKPLITPSPASS